MIDGARDIRLIFTLFWRVVPLITSTGFFHWSIGEGAIKKNCGRQRRCQQNPPPPSTQHNNRNNSGGGLLVSRIMFIPSSATTFPIILFSLLLQSASDALKCKCTQASPKVPCLDGVCEVPTANSACLVLDHPTSGLHYACSTNANLSEGECVSKISKSGANVKVCSCFSSNFCNFKIWPGGQEVPDDDEGEEDEDSGDEEEDEEGFTAGRGRGSRGGAINSATTDMPPVVRRLLLVTMGVVCLLTFPLLLPLPNIH